MSAIGILLFCYNLEDECNFIIMFLHKGQCYCFLFCLVLFYFAAHCVNIFVPDVVVEQNFSRPVRPD